jgi:hypothetical protein
MSRDRKFRYNVVAGLNLISRETAQAATLSGQEQLDVQ